MINKNFYPTPLELINKMVDGVKLRNINTILEPSAGKGDIVEHLNKYYKDNYCNDRVIDCIELDTDLQATLKGKGFHLVHNDFLTYNTYKKYDLIIMNPPFDNGDKHLLKAIRMQERYGGAIICLLNAETLKNPYSNTRRELKSLLDKYNASIEYLENAFANAERETDVEIALVKLNIEKELEESTFLNELRQEEQNKFIEQEFECNEVTKFASENDYIESAVEQYNSEVKLGVKFINEYNAMKPYIKSSLDKESNYGYIIALKIENGECTINSFIQQVRLKYWRALFENPKFTSNLTSNLRDKLFNSVSKLRDYDFSIWNIMTIQQDLMKDTIKGVEDTIIKLFDEFSQQYSYYETSKNIHYYNGWKTNKAWKINDKIILPFSAYDSIWGSLQVDSYRCVEKFTDIIKVFNFLQTKEHKEINVREVLETADKSGQSADIDFSYFTATFYKKGTTHIKFKDMDLLAKFNLFGSQRKGWLPPNFGKANYEDMDNEEKSIVDEFCGSERYQEIINNRDYYLTDTSKVLAIGYNG